MAHTVDEWPMPPIVGSMYPWETWLDGRVWVLTPHIDFTAEIDTIRDQARREAKARGGYARTRRVGNLVYIQAFPKDAPRGSCQK